ncbi:hypothetical protein DUI87_24706 [Hirundo rustica rustica]|uniref:Uncharacterized protein n=1 Tax=Hirundo rustica rustica TaxID=333673 RepID=A0A3M0JC22_HIRRU|nr:hypothetical protein DUI87_24706 [Hirundo rustica rustica]
MGITEDISGSGVEFQGVWTERKIGQHRPQQNNFPFIIDNVAVGRFGLDIGKEFLAGLEFPEKLWLPPWIPGSVQGQVGKGLEPPETVEFFLPMAGDGNEMGFKGMWMTSRIFKFSPRVDDSQCKSKESQTPLGAADGSHSKLDQDLEQPEDPEGIMTIKGHQPTSAPNHPWHGWRDLGKERQENQE